MERKQMYKIETDINHNTTKPEIKLFATTHGCVLSKFKTNGPGGGNHLCEFASHNKHYIMELCDQLDISHSKITYKRVI